MFEARKLSMATIETDLANLIQSPLYNFRIKNGYLPVVGAGSLEAKIMFVGEAPGKQEAETGKPFVGASGRVLDELLQSIGLDRADIYITNIVKDRPPKNRDPKPEEIALYSPLLTRQINIIQPKVIATLGRFAMDYILQQFTMPEAGLKISRLHGQVLSAKTAYGEIAIIPLYHPAVALYNRQQRKTLEMDFKALQTVLYSRE